MKFVEPIKNKEQLEQMKEELKKRGTRDYVMFLVGINTGLRISDIVKLNRNDVRDENNNMRTHITIIETKTIVTPKLFAQVLINSIICLSPIYTSLHYLIFLKQVQFLLLTLLIYYLIYLKIF